MTAVLSDTGVVVGATAANQADAIDQVGRLLVDEGFVTSEYVAAMHERESMVSTYLGNGIALPHGTARHTTRSSAREWRSSNTPMACRGATSLPAS